MDSKDDRDVCRVGSDAAWQGFEERCVSGCNSSRHGQLTWLRVVMRGEPGGEVGEGGRRETLIRGPIIIT